MKKAHEPQHVLVHFSIERNMMKDYNPFHLKDKNRYCCDLLVMNMVMKE